MAIQVGIVGATGYVGAELVRLLSAHPQVRIAALSSVSFEGKPLSAVYPSYYGLCDMECKTQEEVVEKSDVIFAALPHGLSQELAASCMEMGKIMIDMGADFRLEKEGGLPGMVRRNFPGIRNSTARRFTPCRSCSGTRSKASG